MKTSFYSFVNVFLPYKMENVIIYVINELEIDVRYIAMATSKEPKMAT